MSLIRTPSAPPPKEHAGSHRPPPAPPLAIELSEETRPRLTRAYIPPSGILPPLLTPSPTNIRLALSPDSAQPARLRNNPLDDTDPEPIPHLHRTHRTHSGTLPPLLSPPPKLYSPEPTCRPSPTMPTLPAILAPQVQGQTPLPALKLSPIVAPDYIAPMKIAYDRAVLREERLTRPEYRARLLENAGHYLQNVDQACRWLLELSEIATNYNLSDDQRMGIIQALQAKKAAAPILRAQELQLPWLSLLSGTIQDINPEIRALARNWLMTERASFASHANSPILSVLISTVGAAASNSRLPLPERVFWQRQLAKLWAKFLCSQNLEVTVALVKQLGKLTTSFAYGCYDPGVTIAEKQLAIELFSFHRENLLLFARQSPALLDELTKQMEELLSAPGTPEQTHSLAALFLAGLGRPPHTCLPQIKAHPSS